MTFEYDEYYTYFVLTSRDCLVLIGIIILVGIIGWFMRDMIKSKTNFKVSNKRLISLIVPILILLGIAIISFNYDFYLDEEDDIHIAMGTITSIERLDNSPKFTYEDTSVRGSTIIINGEEYTILFIGDFEIGDEVEVSFLPHSKVVLEIQYQDNN